MFFPCTVHGEELVRRDWSHEGAGEVPTSDLMPICLYSTRHNKHESTSFIWFHAFCKPTSYLYVPLRSLALPPPAAAINNREQFISRRPNLRIIQRSLAWIIWLLIVFLHSDLSTKEGQWNRGKKKGLKPRQARPREVQADRQSCCWARAGVNFLQPLLINMLLLVDWAVSILIEARR